MKMKKLLVLAACAGLSTAAFADNGTTGIPVVDDGFATVVKEGNTTKLVFKDPSRVFGGKVVESGTKLRKRVAYFDVLGNERYSERRSSNRNINFGPITENTNHNPQFKQFFDYNLAPKTVIEETVSGSKIRKTLKYKFADGTYKQKHTSTAFCQVGHVCN